MKLRTKSIITLIAMLLGGIGQVAAQDTHEITPPVKSIIYLLDGKSSESAPGSITTETTVSSNGTFTVTLTVTPDFGKTYIEKDNIVVTKTVSGEKAQTREVEIDNEPVELYRVADSETDPTGVTKYYFTFGNVANTRGYWKEGENVYEYEYDYEVTADFQSLIDITNATITLGETTFAYTGQEIKPTVSSVVLNGETIPADNYTVSYLYNIEPAEATAEGDVPTVQISGKLPYIGEITQKFTITKAEATLKYSKETAEATLQAEFEAPTLTVTPEGLEGITYSSSNTNAATIAEDGKVTIVGAGETTITAAFAGDEHYKEAEASYVLTVNKIATELKYSKETAEATMGAEFEAPTLTVTPEGLQGITYSSSNTNAATIAEDGKVTIVGAGETKITATFAGNEIYKSAEASYTLTIKQVKTELKYSTDKVTVAMGAEFEAPTLTVSPEGLAGITYTSSNTNAATISAEGKVTLVGEGQTTIKASFAGNETYEPAEASYTLTVEKGVGEGYALWIGETQVTKDNCEHILGNKDLTFAFNPDSKILLITNNQDEDIVIESRLDELTIYLNGNKDSKSNKLKKVFFNNLGNAENKGKLVFTTNYNVPGSIDLKNDQGESVITGFESVEFDSKSKLTFALPEKTTYEYKNGAMTKTVVDENGTETTSAADELSIGQSLTPIDETVTFTLNNLYLRDEEGNLITDDSGEPTLPNLVNSVVKDVLITLPGSNDNNSGDGISLDDSDGRVGITIETLSMTDDKVKTIAQKVISDDTYFPGSDAFANDFVGMTILLPACTGSITTDLNLDPGYEFHALIAEEDAGKLKSTIKVIPAGKVETPFDVAMPSYCYIYLVQIGASTRLGKREKVHGKVYSVGVSVSKARSVNPPSEASGGALPASGDPNVNEETTPAPPTGIISVNREQQTVKSGWYTLDGQKIAEPKQRGLYIKDGKKVAIK